MKEVTGAKNGKDNEVEEDRKMNCVLMGCENEAVAKCNNCGLPICNRHGKKVDHFFVCVNCTEMLSRRRLR